MKMRCVAGVGGLLLMCLLVGALGAADAQCRFAKAGNGREVTYRFVPETTADGLVMHVTMEFRAGDTGRETLVLPSSWAGETLRALTNLRVVSKGARLVDGGHISERVLEARRNHPVRIAYDLKKDWTGPLVAPLQFHAVLMPEYFEFTGSNALVRLKLGDGAEETANFDWQRLPGAWVLATSFGVSAGTHQSAAQRCQTYSGQWKKVDNGLYAGGDYRLHDFKIGQRPAVLAVRGTWKFTDEEAMTQLAKVIGMVRAFWHDDDFPYFLVTLTPYEADRGGTDGSEFTNAFWLFLQPKDLLQRQLAMIAHESFHAWDPKKMGFLSDKEYGETKWFKEGFTEYYAELLTYRAGELPVAEYMRTINKDLLRFPEPSADEYVRGRVIALWLDGAIRKESGGGHSLDDVMYTMVRESDRPMTLERIFATADAYLSPESQALLQKAVKEHGELPMPEQAPLVGGCYRASFGELPVFDAGFNLDRSTATRVVSGVVEGGPAFAAGLRDGQPLHGYSVFNNDPDRMAKFKVEVNGSDQQIKYYPRGKAIKAWRYEATSDVCMPLP